MRGRKPKPEYLKLLANYPGKRKSKEPPRPKPGQKCPSPPAKLSREGKSEWKRLAPELHTAGLLTGRYRAVFSTYCEAWARYIWATKQLQDKDGGLGGLVVKTGGSETTTTKKNGEVVHVKKNPSYTTHPALWVQNQASQMLLKCAGELGLSPASLPRLAGPAEKKPPSGDWSDFDSPEES